MSKPVLVLIGSDTCPACRAFSSEWKQIKKDLKGEVRFVSFSVSENSQPHPSILKYSTWLPSLLLAEPKSYFTVFTEKDTIVEGVPSTYVIKGEKFNVVDNNASRFEFAGLPHTSDSVVSWVNRVKSKVMNL